MLRPVRPGCVVVLFSAGIPSEIGKLKKLETLSLNGNRIQQLPPTLGQLKALRTLSLAGNQISEFPSGLGTLRQLDLLDLSRNKIQNVPAEVSELQAIEINLNQNQVCKSTKEPEPGGKPGRADPVLSIHPVLKISFTYKAPQQQFSKGA